MWQLIKQHPRAVLYALLVHALLLVFFVFNIEWNRDDSGAGGTQGQPINAVVADLAIDPNLQKELDEQKEAREAEAQTQLEIDERELAAKQLETELAQQEKELAEQKLLEKERELEQEKLLEKEKEQEAENKRVEEEQLKTEAEKERKAADAAALEAKKQKELEEKQALEVAEKKKQEDAEAKAKADAEAKKLAEADAKKKADAAAKVEAAAKKKAEEEARKKEIAAAYAKEQADIAAQAGAAALNDARNQYINAIIARVNSKWITPNRDQGISCKVEVRQTRSGTVLSVVVASGGSCTPEMAESVEKAVLASDPLPKPSDPNAFDRILNFNFEPR